MYFWTLHQIKMMKKNTVSILSHMIIISTISSCHPPYTFKGIPKLSNNFSQTNLMKSLTNSASLQNPIFLIKVIKLTKCNLQLIKLLQKWKTLLQYKKNRQKQGSASYNLLPRH